MPFVSRPDAVYYLIIELNWISAKKRKRNYPICVCPLLLIVVAFLYLTYIQAQDAYSFILIRPINRMSGNKNKTKKSYCFGQNATSKTYTSVRHADLLIYAIRKMKLQKLETFERSKTARVRRYIKYVYAHKSFEKSIFVRNEIIWS